MAKRGIGILRFLLVSDLRDTLKQVDWTMATAPEFETVVIVGDQLNIADQVDASVRLVVIVNCLRRIVRTRRLVRRTRSGFARWTIATSPSIRM